MRILLGQVLPASTAPQNPQNPFQDTAVVDPRTATLAVLARFGKQGSDFLPLHFRQQRTRPGNRPSFGAADFAFLASEKTQLLPFQSPFLGIAKLFGKVRQTGTSRRNSGRAENMGPPDDPRTNPAGAWRLLLTVGRETARENVHQFHVM